MRRVNLSKTVSYILRHHPEDFGIKLAADGSVELEELTEALKNKYSDLTEEDLIELVENDPKGRFSLIEGGSRIKANYGHSIDGIDPDYEAVKPPELLYHGSRPGVKDKIMREGLKPMNRNYVHLSQIHEEAVKVAKRRTDDPVIFKVKALEAFSDGVKFYRAGTEESVQVEVEIYLTDEVKPEYLELKEKYR